MELRHDLRLMVRCPVAYTDSASGRQLLGQGTIVNLSTGGWQVAGSQAVTRGTPLLMRVSLPDGEEPMEVQLATVRWASGLTFGVKNMILGEHEWKRLRRFVVSNASKPDFTPLKLA